jgi:hypothetical protein
VNKGSTTAPPDAPAPLPLLLPADSQQAVVVDPSDPPRAVANLRLVKPTTIAANQRPVKTTAAANRRPIKPVVATSTRKPPVFSNFCCRSQYCAFAGVRTKEPYLCFVDLFISIQRLWLISLLFCILARKCSLHSVHRMGYFRFL